MAIRYVATTGNDTTGDGTSGAPWLTLNKAAIESNSGDTILIAPGSYPETAYSNKIVMDANWSGKTLTFSRNGAGTVTLAANATAAIADSATCLSGNFTFNDITINNANTNTNYSCLTLSQAASSVSVTFNRCVFNPSSPITAALRVLLATSPNRNITVDSCTFNAVAGAEIFLALVHASSTTCTFTNNTVNWLGSGQTTLAVVQLGGEASSVVTTANISGNTINADSAGATSTGSVIQTGTLLAGTLTISNNTIAARCGCIQINPPAAAATGLTATISGNTLTMNSATNGYAISLGTNASTATYNFGVIAVDNNVVNVKGTSDGMVAIFAGPEADNCTITNNRIRGQNYWNPGTDAGIGIYTEGCASPTVTGNDVLCRGAYVNVIANGATVRRNVFHATTGTGTNGAAVDLRDNNVTGTPDLLNLTFVGNTVIQDGSGYVLSYAPHDASMDISSFTVDSNRYWRPPASGGETNAFYAVDAAKTLTTLRTYWAGLGGSAATNDANSVFSVGSSNATMATAMQARRTRRR